MIVLEEKLEDNKFEKTVVSELLVKEADKM